MLIRRNRFWMVFFAAIGLIGLLAASLLMSIRAFNPPDHVKVSVPELPPGTMF